MNTRELPPAEWTDFCRNLSETHRNTLVAVNAIEQGHRKQVFDDVPLQNISFQRQDNTCSDALIIEAGQPGEKPACHLIVEPIRLVLRNPTAEGRYQELEILAENGTNTVRLHPAVAL